MKTRYMLIFSLSVFALTCCVDLEKPSALANCTANNSCFDIRSGSDRPNAPDAYHRLEAISSNPDASLLDTRFSKDSTPPDAIILGPEVSIDARPDVRDTALAEGPPDTIVPDSRIPDTSLPDTSLPDTHVPDTHVPDTRIPDTRIPDTRIPDTSVPDTNTGANCPTVYLRSGVNSYITHSGLDGYCIVLCDDFTRPLFGWDCYTFAGREVKVNGQAVACGQRALPDKVNGHYVFEISAGSETLSTINWWGQLDTTVCPYTKGDPLP